MDTKILSQPLEGFFGQTCRITTMLYSKIFYSLMWILIGDVKLIELQIVKAWEKEVLYNISPKYLYEMTFVI